MLVYGVVGHTFGQPCSLGEYHHRMFYIAGERSIGFFLNELVCSFPTKSRRIQKGTGYFFFRCAADHAAATFLQMRVPFSPYLMLVQIFEYAPQGHRERRAREF